MFLDCVCALNRCDGTFPLFVRWVLPSAHETLGECAVVCYGLAMYRPARSICRAMLCLLACRILLLRRQGDLSGLFPLLVGCPVVFGSRLGMSVRGYASCRRLPCCLSLTWSFVLPKEKSMLFQSCGIVFDIVQRIDGKAYLFRGMLSMSALDMDAEGKLFRELLWC